MYMHTWAHVCPHVCSCMHTHAVVTYHYLFQDTQFTCSFTINIVSECCVTISIFMFLAPLIISLSFVMAVIPEVARLSTTQASWLFRGPLPVGGGGDRLPRYVLVLFLWGLVVISTTCSSSACWRTSLPSCLPLAAVEFLCMADNTDKSISLCDLI
jgi:hypothetical protein